MNLSRSISKSIGRMLVGVLLFAQLAVASYACPNLSGMVAAPGDKSAIAMPVAAVADTVATQPATMPPGCDQMDPAVANLCAEHCRYGQQSVDTVPVTMVHVAIPTFLYSLPLEPQRMLGSGRSFPAPDARLAAAPPHAILHCVFRI